MTSETQELRELIAAKLANPGVLEPADAVAELFYDVRDDWDAIDITRLGDGPPGTRVLDQRWLVARVPRESRERLTKPDRTVTP